MPHHNVCTLVVVGLLLTVVCLWKTLAEDFPDQLVINRGFGGSEIVDITHFDERVIFPYAPRMIYFRAGGNDHWAGMSPERVFADFKEFVRHTRKLNYIETYSMSLDADGKPRPDPFVADQLHLNVAGYKLLAERVRPFLPKEPAR